MNKLERVLTTLHHELPDVIPNQEGFFDSTSQDKFLPAFAERRDWRPIEEPLTRQLTYAELMDTYIVTVGNGSLRSKVIERGDNHHILEFENAAKWRIREQPFSRQYVDLPIRVEEDLDRMPMPDPRDPSRYQGVEERARFFTEKGYFTAGGIDGFFSGVWYRFRRYEDFMMDLAANRDFAKRIIRVVGEYNLASAEELLKRGVHSISFPDDLGGKTGTFFSPECYRACFYEWHRRLCELCHSYGAYVNMHSHGDINALLPALVEAGVDILNPVGPTDNMNLAEIKEKYGDRITLLGGISKFIGEMSREELESHVEEVIHVGSPGGGYMTMSEGGIPYTMSHEDFTFYLDILRKYREKYGAG
jgi:uroporphyrinogen decarboxylase